MRRAAGWMAAAMLVGLGTAGAGAQNLVMPPSKKLPAARIQVQLGHDQNGNTTVDLKAQHLAQPQNLNPADSVYVVWVRQNGQPAEREGQLVVDSDLNGELKFTTPARHFTILITVENSETPAVPGETVVSGAVARAQGGLPPLA